MGAAKVSDENSQVQKSSLELEGWHRDNESHSITSTYSALMMLISKEGT